MHTAPNPIPQNPSITIVALVGFSLPVIALLGGSLLTTPTVLTTIAGLAMIVALPIVTVSLIVHAMDVIQDVEQITPGIETTPQRAPSRTAAENAD